VKYLFIGLVSLKTRTAHPVVNLGVGLRAILRFEEVVLNDKDMGLPLGLCPSVWIRRYHRSIVHVIKALDIRRVLRVCDANARGIWLICDPNVLTVYTPNAMHICTL